MDIGDIVRKKTSLGYKYGEVIGRGYFTSHHWMIRYENDVIEESAYILEVVLQRSKWLNKRRDR